MHAAASSGQLPSPEPWSESEEGFIEKLLRSGAAWRGGDTAASALARHL